MPPTYSETHHLNVDDAGLASVHVAVHLQNVNPQIAHLLVLRVLDAASAVAAVPEQGVPGQVIRPQTSGLCVHYDPDGSAPEDGDGPDYREDPPLCAYPYPCKDGCPHLDNPDVICPVKDACAAMSEVARMRDACEAEQEGQVSSLCGYYDERSEHVDTIDPCTHPDACKTGCPYLNDDWIYCPQKDEWSAASKQAEEDLAWAWGDDIPKFVPLTQDPEGWGTDMVAEAPDTIPRSDYVPAPEDPQAQADDAGKSEPEFPEPVPEEEPVYETAAPEWVEPEPDDGALHTYTVPATRKPHPNAWSDEEEEAIRRARNAKEAATLYYGAYPQSSRTHAAVQSRWYQLRAAGKLIEPEPEEPDFTVPHPTFRPGDRVRIKHALYRGQTGKIERYFPATDNYLVAIDGLPDRIILRDKDLEVV